MSSTDTLYAGHIGLGNAMQEPYVRRFYGDEGAFYAVLTDEHANVTIVGQHCTYRSPWQCLVETGRVTRDQPTGMPGRIYGRRCILVLDTGEGMVELRGVVAA